MADRVTDEWLTMACPQPCPEYAASAQARQDRLTKPQGSLGVLERLAVQLAAFQQTDRPQAGNVPIVLFAGDHGITAQGVSAYPSAVTVQMLHNFANGGAAISVLARELGVSLQVVDAGTVAASEIAGVIRDKPRLGTRDFSSEPAMMEDEVRFALATGRRAVQRAAGSNVDLIILGEMGIGNTTSASAIAAALLGSSPSDLVGAGTGLNADGIGHKASVIAAALAKHGLSPSSAPLGVMACVGGLEIAALVGAIIAAAQATLPVLVDGFIVSVAALTAVRLNASCQPWLLYSHRSSEHGHRKVLEALNADPILDLKLRLGEGSGAAVALPIVRLACALHSQMATFDQAHVSGRESCL